MTIAEIISRAIHDAGTGVVTYVPGYGGSDVFRALEKEQEKKLVVSFHEEPAYAIAHGAALTGTRAVCLFKTHGIMKAGNAVSDSLFAGTTAGFVSIISEDRDGTHSDSIIESEPFLKGIGMPYLVTTPENVYRDLFRAFELSEKMNLPYGLLIDVDSIKSQGQISTGPDFIPPVGTKKYVRNVQQHVMAPLFNPYQRKVYEAKMAGTDWKSIPVPPLPLIPESTPPNWKKIVETYVPFFSVFKKFRGDIVTGDTGVSSQFCSEPWHCIDIVTYMGSSISLAIGTALSGFKNVWAITGDFSFISAGHLGLMEAKLREIPVKVIILYNGKASTTGGQIIPEGSLETLLGGYREYVRWIKDPSDEENLERILQEMTESSRMEIAIVDYRRFF